MKAHGNMYTQPIPCEQAKQKTPAGGKEEWANSPCSFLTKKSN